MLKQVFKEKVPKTILIELLEQICVKNENYYIIDYNSYKKLVYNNLHERLAETIKDYYFSSKQFYATRKMTYKSFINIIRHICKSCGILYTSNIKYNESKYIIYYYIYHSESIVSVKTSTSSVENAEDEDEDDENKTSI